MKTIVCCGDSHTCGEGATGFTTKYDGKYNVQGKGIGRNSEFDSTNYVNLIRNYLTENTASRAWEVSGKELAESNGLPNENDLCLLHGDIELDIDCDAVFVMVGEKTTETAISIYLDGAHYKTERLYAAVTRYDDFSYRYIPVFCEGAKRLKISGEGVYIAKLEFNEGEFAVVNSGVGSCPVARFTEECFDYCLADFKRYMVIAEAFTINDWLTKESPLKYKENLKAFINKTLKIGAKMFLVTVSPILGEQAEPFNSVPYCEFVRASIDAGREAGVTVVDANAAMTEHISGLSEEKARELLFSDNGWHVNDFGYRIYADSIIQKCFKRNEAQ